MSSMHYTFIAVVAALSVVATTAFNSKCEDLVPNTNLKPMDGDFPMMHMTFINSVLEEDVNVYAVDEDGDEVFKRRVKHGEDWTTHTYETTPFRMRGQKSHRLLKEVVAGQTPSIIINVVCGEDIPVTEGSFLRMQIDTAIRTDPKRSIVVLKDVELNTGTYLNDGPINIRSGRDIAIKGTSAHHRPVIGLAITSEHQLFSVQMGGSLKLTKLHLKGGYQASGNPDILAGGGAIENDGTVVIEECVFENNQAYYGGAIFNRGDLSVIRSSFLRNDAQKWGGAILNRGSAVVERTFFDGNAAKWGGAVDTEGAMTLTSCTFKRNNAEKGEHISYYGSLTNINYCTFEDGDGEGESGAVLNRHDELRLVSSESEELSSAVTGCSGGIGCSVIGGKCVCESTQERAWFVLVGSCAAAMMFVAASALFVYKKMSARRTAKATVMEANTDEAMKVKTSVELKEPLLA